MFLCNTIMFVLRKKKEHGKVPITPTQQQQKIKYNTHARLSQNLQRSALSAYSSAADKSSSSPPPSPSQRRCSLRTNSAPAIMYWRAPKNARPCACSASIASLTSRCEE